MRHFIFLTSLFFLINLSAFAQKEANFWYFSDQAGLDFNSGSPIALTNGALAHPADGCTSVSDSNGNLLFYSDGVRVWNRNHVQMPNGFGLMGHISSSQSVVAFLKPGSSTLYYLFTVDAIENNLVGGLRYSVLDMNLANGFGDITLKNVLLETPVTENLTVTRHANNIDYWVISHRWNSNSYTAYLVTSNGVATTPVISNVGVSVSGSFLNATCIIKASPDGSKLAHSIRDLHLFQLLDFNNSTGVASNVRISPATYPIPYGVEFSPDATKLYGTELDNNYIYQFDLNAPNIFSSGIIIGNMPFRSTDIQNGPNGKIYCSQRDNSYLGVINNPNIRGIGCNYVSSAIYLGGRKNWFGLPNFPTNLFRKAPVSTFTFSNDCAGEKINFSITGYQPSMTVTWNFGDSNSGSSNTSTIGNPSHIFSAPGSYQVTLVIVHNGLQSTITKNVVVKAAPVVNLGNDTSLCIGQTLLLGNAPLTGYSYKWQDGSNKSTFLANKSGTYVLEVVANGCKAIDSINVIYNYANDFSLGNDTILCEGSTLLLGRKPLSGLSYSWQDGSTESTFLANNPGVYTLEVSRENCDKVFVSIRIDNKDCSLFIPNIITPNKDGLNDYFSIRGINAKDYKLRILNRWGNSVYETKSYQNDWNAHNTAAGVYYYLLRHNQTGKTFKGWLEVIK